MDMSYTGFGIQRGNKLIMKMYPEYRAELKQFATKKHYTELWMDRDMYHVKRLTPYHVEELTQRRIFQNKTLSASRPVRTERGLHLQWSNSERILHTCQDVILPYLEGVERVRWYGDQYTGVHHAKLCGGKEGTFSVITPTFHAYSDAMCMATYKDEPCVVYEWYPLQLCKLKNHHLLLSTILYTTPEWFKDLKASTNCVLWKGQQWVVLTRTYVYKKQGKFHTKMYHLLAVLDDAFHMKYSEFFRIDSVISDLHLTEEGISIGHSESGKCYFSKYTWEEVNGLRWCALE